jgi:uncharacterized protein YkwD
MRLSRLSKRVATVAIGSAALIPAPASASAECPNADAQPDQVSVYDYAKSLICEVNVQRAAWGRAGLAPSTRLDHAAAGQSRDMVERGYFSHTSPDGHTLADRLDAVGFIPHSTRYRWSAGENLAAGEGSNGTPAAIAAAWMRSPTHRSNLVDPDFRMAGIGLARGMPRRGEPVTNAMTITLDFGFRRLRARSGSS